MSDSSPAPSAAPAAPAGPQPSDVASDLTAAWDAQESPDSGSNAPASSGKSSSSSSSEAGGKADDSGTRTRDEGGRFTKTNGAQTVAPAGDKPAPAKPEANARPDAKAPDAKPPDAKGAEFRLPEKWPAEVKARYESLAKVSPEHAQWMVEEFNKVQTQQGVVNQARAKLGPLQKIVESVETLLAPGRVQRAQQGIGDAEYVRGLVAAGEALDKNPEQGLRYLAQKYGVDLQRLVTGEGQEPQIPEHVQRVMQENAQIKAFLANQMHATHQQELGRAMGAIDQFASQKDANGNAKYPHFDEVIHEVIANVQYQREQGQNVNLDAAYHRAVRMNDSVWLKVQGARSEADRKSAEEKRLKDIEEARRAGFTPSGSGGVASDRPADSLRGELERQWEQTHR